jgi:hypothetical protein
MGHALNLQNIVLWTVLALGLGLLAFSGGAPRKPLMPGSSLPVAEGRWAK